MTTVIYGGSFNPPHSGHVSAAKAAAKLDDVDRVLIIPDRIPPHKKLAVKSPTAAERMELCSLAFHGIPKTEISNLEQIRTGKSYTSDTIAQLREIYPEDTFLLLIGTDMLLSFDRWHCFQNILQECTLLVVSREEDDTDAIQKYARYLKDTYHARIRILKKSALAVSSSQIREKLAERGGKNCLPEKVYAKIIQKRYYDAKPNLAWLRKKAYAYLDAKRVSHVAGCEKEAVLLAKRWGEEEDDAAEAAILHDITKRLKRPEQCELVQKYHLDCDEEMLQSGALLHAVTGAAFSRDLFGIPQEIYDSIRWHTTGKPDMSLLEKIIYMADYIEPTRDFDGVQPLRKLAYQDLDAAIGLGLKMSLEDIRSRGQVPYYMTAEASAYYNREERKENADS